MNRDNQPCKMRNINITNSIYCKSGYGPIFGTDDITIANNANTIAGSHSYLSRSYHYPQPNDASYLAGSSPFQLSEIEVYQKE
jgi:hypothetical protein